MEIDDSLANQDFCYVTTTGRRTGKPHRIEIWFGARGGTLYLLSGGGRLADWVLNLEASPAVSVEINGHEWTANARVVTDPEEELAARHLLAAKYQDWREGAPMSRWASTALPVAIDLT